ncbi:carotenoid oxygenase family protein [Streptomyces sp. NPDC020096]
MVHGIRLRDGRAEWYRNRWVHTPALDGAPYMTETGPDLTASTAGTHVIEHAGRLLALCEANFPFELTRDLDTLGAYDFNGRAAQRDDRAPEDRPRHHVVFVEGSVTFDPTEHSGIPYGWSDDQPARIGVMPRGPQDAGKIRWFPIEPGNMLHTANAYEDAQGRIVLEAPPSTTSSSAPSTATSTPCPSPTTTASAATASSSTTV